jgi:hypothetical protein
MRQFKKIYDIDNMELAVKASGNSYNELLKSIEIIGYVLEKPLCLSFGSLTEEDRIIIRADLAQVAREWWGVK